MIDSERFDAFFATVNGGARPYPWQRALVERVAATGHWPDIVAPTGAGKSSVVDIHVFLVAEHAAGRLKTRPPRRLVLVAPRRVLVDDHYERALRLSAVLHDAATHSNGTVLAEVATALDALRTASSVDGHEPLPVWRLRGGVLLDDGWRLEPAACQVICATPQMWGSRLLLRGYAATRRSRNLEAGLLGHDAAAVVDEAHLHERLLETARRVADRSACATRLQVVAMSATQAAGPGQAGIGQDDLADPALRRRVHAVKRIELVHADDRPAVLQRAIAERAIEASGGGTVGVFVNDVPTALDVAGALEADGLTVELVCGRLRPADLARLRRRRPALLSPKGDPDVDMLVSTQSLEVGVDLDLGAMVSALASATALAQRAGRLNRSGSRPATTLTIVVPGGGTDTDGKRRRSGPYAPKQLEAALGWLEQLDGSISPFAVTGSQLPLPERPSLAALRHPDLMTLAMTTDVQAADPDPSLYLEDPRHEVAELGVIARRHLDLDAGAVRAALRACPPRPHETATMPLGTALERIAHVVADAAWVVRVTDGELEVLTRAEADAFRPGDVLVVPDGAAICTAGVIGVGEGRGAPGPLNDVLDEALDGQAQDRIVPLEVADMVDIVSQDRALTSRAGRSALAAVLATAGQPELADRLRQHRRLAELELSWCGPADEATAGLLVVRDMRTRAVQAPLAVPAEAVTVDAHQNAVADRVDRIVDALMTRDAGEHRSQLVLAARTHDDGKRHPRFQRRMGAADVPLAKPSPGHVPDRGDGWRHEQLSAAYAARASGGDRLVVTLVGAHHGAGRPLFDRRAADLLEQWEACPPDVRAWAIRLFGPCGRYELLRDRAQHDLGVHQLAWLEALLRCADMQVSREGG